MFGIKNPYPDLSALSETPAANPAYLCWEPTDRCNTKCAFCGHFNRNFGADMSEEVFQKVCASLLDDARHVDLVGYGEPFIAGHFERMWEECRKRSLSISTTTNGIVLHDDELVARIVRTDILLRLSIDGARAETFEFCRPFIKWRKMIDVLESLKRHADAAGPERRYRLHFNFVAIKKNIGDLPDLVRLAAKYGAGSIQVLPLANLDELERMRGQELIHAPELVRPAFLEAYRLATQHGIALDGPSAFRQLITDGADGGGARGRLTRLRRRARHAARAVRRKGLGHLGEIILHGNGPRAKTGNRYCLIPWDTTYLAADGKVYPCCRTIDELGDLNTQSWNEIWRGQLYRNLRRTSHGWNPTEICRTCPVHNGINGGDQEKYQKVFAPYRRETIPLDANGVQFDAGFHPLERHDDGSPSHHWMGQTGRLTLSAPPGAKFLRLEIVHRWPNPTPNPGRVQINGGAWEYFDNTCPELHFPLSGAQGGRRQLTFEMENAHRVEGDPRELALGVRGLQFLLK